MAVARDKAVRERLAKGPATVHELLEALPAFGQTSVDLSVALTNVLHRMTLRSQAREVGGTWSLA